MKQIAEPSAHDRALRSALKSMPVSQTRLSTNFTWRTMEAIHEVELRRRKRQELVVRRVGLVACVIIAIAALGLGTWIATPILGAAFKQDLADIPASAGGISPVLGAIIIAVPVLIAAERLLYRTYIKQPRKS